MPKRKTTKHVPVHWADLWGPFLECRRDLIEAFRRDGKSCTEIARTLSMDPGQVYLISRVEVGTPPDDAREAILAVQRACGRPLHG